MPITLAETRRIADLAHLRLEESEAGRLRGDLGQILGYVQALSRLDTVEVAPALGLSGGHHPEPGRPDTVAPCLDREQALANAPESAAGHFKVPRVLP